MVQAETDVVWELVGSPTSPFFSKCGPKQFCEPLIPKVLSLENSWITENRSAYVLDTPIWFLITLQPPCHRIVPQILECNYSKLFIGLEHNIILFFTHSGLGTSFALLPIFHKDLAQVSHQPNLIFMALMFLKHHT